MPAPLPKPGDILAGKYRVERVLGSGGMGVVVAARHLQLDQLVAIKFLRRGTEAGEDASKRFLREAKAAVKLHNEHVARVYDVGTLDTGEPYIVMEYLEGRDLSALAVERGPIPVAEAAEYVLQACEALAEAHSQGIIHRDIKLANLFVTRGRAGPIVKVLDFGVSKISPFGESEQEMTRSASMLGSPRFMSPEQMRDPRAVDGRTDIWSLGVVLYRLVSGRTPFEAETLGHLLSMVMHDREPPLSSHCPSLPPGFEQLVARCMQKAPTARFSTVAELAGALVPFTHDPLRARASAETIASMQGVSLAASLSVGSGSSSSNWQGHVSSLGVATARRTNKSIVTSLLATLLVLLLIGSALFAKHRSDAWRAANAGAQPANSTTEATASAAAAEPPTAAATILGASSPSGTPSSNRPRPSSSARTKAPADSSSSAARPAPSKDDNDIPETRE